ncbi:MAG: glycosyltransferase family 4 protein [Candidatus Aminicenantes bacterium]|nr:MAG: glycosyltransferase family 4 protein [Candidatus Aminicenantes bacterium]
MRVDQLVPAFHRGDAIGDTAFHMKKFFLSQGLSSQIYCLESDKGLEGDSAPFASFRKPASSDITILHFALPSPLSQKFLSLRSKKVIIYHNITPPEFFADFSPEMERISRLGREELESLVPHVNLALADSEYNRQELLELGFKNADVFPLFVDLEKYEKPLSNFTYSLFNDERINILFVGRIVPNKKIEDLIKVVFYYKKYISPLVRLIVVGKTSSLPKYYQSLVRLADEFYLMPEEIFFAGHIPDEELFALYKASDLFLSLSEHEGFGLPFIESMIFDLPIVAYDCTAVPYTLGGAGVLIRDKSVDLLGELVNVVAHNKKLKENIIKGQRQRLEEFKKAEREKFLLQVLKTL